jgi:hypothetical protein
MAEKRSSRKSASKGSLRPRGRSKGEKWSSRVTNTSDALDLKGGVFKLKSPRAIARSLQSSAERSSRRKTTPFRSAMSMLNFEINRAGRSLSIERKRVLNDAKQELRKLYGRGAD